MIDSSFKKRCSELVWKYPKNLKKAAKVLAQEYSISEPVALIACRSQMMNDIFGG